MSSILKHIFSSLALSEGKALKTLVTCSCFIHLQADRQTNVWVDR